MGQGITLQLEALRWQLMHLSKLTHALKRCQGPLAFRNGALTIRDHAAQDGAHSRVDDDTVPKHMAQRWHSQAPEKQPTFC
jgi:hypothetical protein